MSLSHCVLPAETSAPVSSADILDGAKPWSASPESAGSRRAARLGAGSCTANASAAGSGLVHTLCLPGGPGVTVRPAEPQDAPDIQSYIRRLPPRSRHRRFLGALNELSENDLHRMTHADLRHEVALIAETIVNGARLMIGEACYAMSGDGLSCEIAISVAEDWERRTLGSRLLEILARHARSVGARYLTGDVLSSNDAMAALARKTGWVITTPVSDARLIRITKDLSLATGSPEMPSAQHADAIAENSSRAQRQAA